MHPFEDGQVVCCRRCFCCSQLGHFRGNVRGGEQEKHTAFEAFLWSNDGKRMGKAWSNKKRRANFPWNEESHRYGFFLRAGKVGGVYRKSYFCTFYLREFWCAVNKMRWELFVQAPEEWCLFLACVFFRLCSGCVMTSRELFSDSIPNKNHLLDSGD